MTLTDVLERRANLSGEKRAYTFLANGENEADSLTFLDLRRRARIVAAHLSWRNARGERAILLYPQGLEFIVAFFACLYAGVIAVPASIPSRKHGLEALRRVAKDADARWILSTSEVLEQLAAELASEAALLGINYVDTTALRDADAEWQPPPTAADDVALLQYTSGSSGSPRGVVVTHLNLVANQRQIALSFGHDEATVAVSWLPMFHDMGLGTVLGAAWGGCHCILMSPQAFLQKPARWLESITRYGGSCSGGPDFAYDLCTRRVTAEQRAGLDLSSWTAAYNGSEPVRAATLERFVEAFGSCGFKKTAFLPVYGLAEATLLVTSGRRELGPLVRRFPESSGEAVSGGQLRVGCGAPAPGTRIAIMDPSSREECGAGQVGEIWVRGASVAAGYWRNERETLETFGVRAASGEGDFLRTGDLGFLTDGELFVTGRRKDLIIVRGRNHYPQDIEDSVLSAHRALVPGACAAFSVETEQGEELVVVAEVERSAVRTLDAPSVVRAIRGAISARHALQTHATVLIKPSTLPRTTSGKVRRRACREAFLARTLPALGAWVSPLAPLPNTDAEPDRAQRELSARADHLIEWLRRYGADLINAHAAADPKASPLSLLHDLAKQGILGMQVQPRYGGLGLGHADALRVLEQLAAIDFALALFVGLHHSLGVEPIAKHGSSGLKDLLLPGLAQGRELAAFAFDEPAGSSKPQGIAVAAQADGEDRWRLFGTKYLDGAAQRPSVINVFARHEEPPGISAFVITEGLGGLRPVPAGFSTGLLGFGRETIALDGVPVTRDSLLASLGSGIDVAREAMALTRLAIGAACIGGMKRCAQWVGREGSYGDSITGKLTPNPVVLSRLGSITAGITALECLVHRVACATDAGYAVPAEAFAACKIQGPELLLRCVDDITHFGLSGARAAETDLLSCLHRDAGFLRSFGGQPEALCELTGAGVMADDSSLRRLVEEALWAPQVSPRIDVAVAAVRQRMLHLDGALATRAERWGHTRLGELTAWLVLLAAVAGSRSSSGALELERARAWAEAQFEQALTAVRFGTPSETAALNAADIAATFASYARTIGELHGQPKPSRSEPSPTTETLGAPSREARVRELSSWITSWLARRLQIGVSQIDMGRSFADHGLDSLAAVELAKALSDRVGRELDETLLWNFSTIDALAGHVIDAEQPRVSTSVPPVAATAPGVDSGSTLEDELARLERELGLGS